MSNDIPNIDVLFIEDSNVKSVAYNRSDRSMKVVFGGGSEWKYYFIKQEIFDSMLNNPTGLAILDQIRHNNLVGIRLK